MNFCLRIFVFCVARNKLFLEAKVEEEFKILAEELGYSYGCLVCIS